MAEPLDAVVVAAYHTGMTDVGADGEVAVLDAPKPPAMGRRRTMIIPSAMWDRLTRYLMAGRVVSYSEVIRRALDEYLQREGF